MPKRVLIFIQLFSNNTTLNYIEFKNINYIENTHSIAPESSVLSKQRSKKIIRATLLNNLFFGNNKFNSEAKPVYCANNVFIIIIIMFTVNLLIVKRVSAQD